MKPTESVSTLRASTLSTAELFRRIDEMSMSPQDRERAKATLAAAERIAEALASIASGLKSLTARIARASTRRSTLRNSPVPR